MSVELDEVIASVSLVSKGILAQLASHNQCHESGSKQRAAAVTIRMADSYWHQGEIDALLARRYAQRGYSAPVISISTVASSVITLAAVMPDHSVVGTVTLGVDGVQGLLCDESYADVVSGYRGNGERLCEFGKLALDLPEGDALLGRYVMGALVHVAYIFARHIHGCSRAFIEVNPRHVRFYQRCLGFEVAAEERVCVRAGAPAVLLQVPFQHVDRQIQVFGGQGKASRSKSLYPFWFSAVEHEGIVGRLRRTIRGAAN